MKKFFLVVVPLLILLAVVAVIVVGSSASKVVSGAIEYAGSHYLEVPVEVGAISIAPWSGAGSIENLVIGNPEGFKTDHAFKLTKVELALDIKSLFSDEIVVKKLHIVAPDITCEIGLGKTNIGTLKKTAEANLGSGDESKETAEEPAAEEPAAEKKLLIQDFQLNEAKLAVSATALQGARGAVTLPSVQMTDVSKDSAGEVLVVVFGAVADAILEKVKEVGSGAGGGLESGVEAGKKVLGGMMNQFLGKDKKDQEKE